MNKCIRICTYSVVCVNFWNFRGLKGRAVVEGFVRLVPLYSTFVSWLV